jgi:hypothetical protein
MLQAMRVQANFAEYVPFAVLLLVLAEIQGLPDAALHAAGLLLVAEPRRACSRALAQARLQLRAFLRDPRAPGCDRPPLVVAAVGDYSSFSISGTRLNRSPTRPMSATSKIGASESLLIATIVRASLMTGQVLDRAADPDRERTARAR